MAQRLGHRWMAGHLPVDHVNSAPPWFCTPSNSPQQLSAPNFNHLPSQDYCVFAVWRAACLDRLMRQRPARVGSDPSSAPHQAIGLQRFRKKVAIDTTRLNEAIIKLNHAKFVLKRSRRSACFCRIDSRFAVSSIMMCISLLSASLD